MKTKTAVFSIAFTFLSCALFAQNKHDTVPQPTRTDTIHRTDSTSTVRDTSKVSAFVIHPQTESSTQGSLVFIGKRILTAKKNEVIVFCKIVETQKKF